MITASLLLSAAHAGSGAPPPPPVVVVDGQMPVQPVRAISWRCNATSADHQALVLSGGFPAVSADDQKNGGAYRLNATLKGSGKEGFSGTFPAALTFNLVGMTNYSISIPNPQRRISSYVLKLEFFEPSRSGFVSVLQFDPTTGAPTAYATGLCNVQVSS
jgi:hypothetical protein